MKSMAYEKYSRDDLWGSGKLTTDLLNLDHKKLNESQKKFKIKKMGDIVACPIPNIVMERRGFKKAYEYFSSLAKNYIKIKNIMEKENPSLLPEWGKLERRKERPGKYFERLPEKYKTSKKVIGAGKYHEFLITRLLWMRKNLTPTLPFSAKKLTEVIRKSKSVTDLHSRLITEMIKIRLKQGFNVEEVSYLLATSIYHPGFTEQNNCFKEIKAQLRDIKNKVKNQERIKDVVIMIDNDIKRKRAYPD